MKITLKNVRLAFPELFEAKTVQGEGKPAFSASFLLAKDDPQAAAIREAEEATGKDKWGAKWPTVKKELVANNRLAMKDGDAKASYAGFEGNFFVSARNETRPTVIGLDRSPLTPRDGKPYSGCYVNVILEIWPQDNSYGKRINAGLAGVQFLRDGEPFSGGRPADADDFEDLSNVGEEEALV